MFRILWVYKMPLNLPRIQQIFPHSKAVDTGIGNVRIGQATVIVTLDGTGDTDSIQDGIDLLPSIGGTVYIKEGTYNISTQITINKSNIIISGSGKSTIIKTGVIIPMIYANGKSGITIENIYFLGYNAGDTDLKGIKIVDGEEIKIRNCWFFDLGVGIAVESTDASINRTCIIESNFLKFSLGGAHSGIQVNKNSGTIVANNQIRGTSFYAAAIFHSHRCIITGNEAQDGSGSAFTIYTDASNTADNNIISNNVSIGNARGIWLNHANCNKNIIIGNICLLNTTAQISDSGTNTHPNGASGTNNLALDDLNIIA